MKMPALVFIVMLTGCVAPEPPNEPIGWHAPSALLSGEEKYIVNTATATVPLAPKALREFFAANGGFIAYMQPVGDLAPPASSDAIEGTWPDEGAQRRLTLADGHQLLERSLRNELGDFRYQAFGFTNAAGRGIDHIYADWKLVETEDGGTRFTWTYRLAPKNPIAAIFVRRIRDRDLAPFMQGAMDRMALAVREATAEE